MTNKPNSLEARDAAHHLHGFTNPRQVEKDGATIMSHGEGIYVYDTEGNQYMEGLGGLWNVAVGFSNKRLADVGAAQLHELPYYSTFNGNSPKAAAELAVKLAEITPDSVTRSFFCNSGSEANDTAVKLVWFYNNALGRTEKKKFIARDDAYHGVTMAAASLSGLVGLHASFDLPILPVIHVTKPHHHHFADPGESEEDFATRLAQEVEDVILEEGPDTVAAFIGEPVMGAGGVIVPPRTYWEKIQKVCRKYDVLLIADEVICGFGRTGKMFACEVYDIEPDILVLSKGITSGYAPLAALMFSDKIYQVIADHSAEMGMFPMGFTASGHPLSSAIAVENIKIIEEDGLVENSARMGLRLQAGLKRLADTHPLVTEARGVGLLGAVELGPKKGTNERFDPPGSVGPVASECIKKHGLIARATGDEIYVCPPLIITEDEMDDLLRRIEVGLNDAYEILKKDGVIK